MKKRSINPNKFRIFSFLISGIFLIVLNTFLTNFAMDKVFNMTTQKFMESYSLNATGYTKIVEQILDKYTNFLDVYDESFLTENSPQQIQKYLIKNANKSQKVFSSASFATTDGFVYTNTGIVYKTPKPDFFSKLIEENDKNFITDPYIDFTNGKPNIAFAKIIYDKNGQKKGALTSSMKLEQFYDLLSKVYIGGHQTFTIESVNGTVVYNRDKTQLNTKMDFSFAEVIKKRYNAFNIIQEGISRSIDSSNHEILIFFNKIEYTNWYLGLSIPEEEYDIIYDKYIKYQSIIIIVSALMVIIVLIAELKITEHLRKKDMLEILFDPVTKLLTRQQFDKEAEKILHKSKNSKFMIIETDIHGFKFINQNFGVEEANEVLVFFAKILSNRSELNKALLCRGYADHFFVLVKIVSVHKAMTEFKRSLIFLNECIKNYKIQFFPKFGISFYIPNTQAEREKNVSIQELIAQAVLAKNTIKNNILNSYAIFDSNLLKKSNNDHYIESHMKQALADREFFVMYQPKINLKTDKIIGAEALVRWNSSKLGLLQPNKFIPLFEKNDFVIELDFYVYEEVFKFLRKCLDENIPVVPVSLNMARNHSKPEIFVKRFLSVFEKYNLPTSLIEIEILERSVMDKETLKTTTLMLHKVGFKVAMDDFGSGESSLNMLTNIPVDILKFDKSFLDYAKHNEGKTLDEDAGGVIKSLISLGKQLKKQTVFEGVETEEQRDFLKSAECDIVQGFLYSKPLSENEYISFLEENY